MKLIKRTWTLCKACFTRKDYFTGVVSLILFPLFCWLVWWIEGVTADNDQKVV